MRSKRILSAVLAAVILVSLTVPAVAATGKTFKKYENYVCLGDSIAAGCSLSKSGMETYFDPDVEDPIATYNSDVIHLGLDFSKVKHAYHSIIAEKLGATLLQCSRSALRTVELRYFLDGVYNDMDSEYVWGKQFLGDDLTLEVNEDLDVMAYLKEMEAKGKVKSSVKKADLITLNIGCNDVFSYPVVLALNQLSTKIPELSVTSALLKKTGNIGSALGGLIEASNSLLTGTIVAATLLENVNSAVELYKQNFTAILKDIYKLNPDVTVVIVGMYNPLKNAQLKSNGVLKLDALAASTVNKVNTFLAGLTSQYSNLYYAGTADTEVYQINMNDTNAVDLFLLKAHPTLAGHQYIAEQILSVLPSGLGATKLKISTSSHKIKLSWNAVDYVTGYNVYRATSASGSYKKIASTKELSYTDSSAKPGTKYYYRVCASRGTLEGSFSNTVSGKYTMAAPKVTISNNTTTGKLHLSWNKIAGAEKYEVWRATSKNGTYKKMLTTKNLTYTNTSAVAGHTYYYKVRAVCGSSCGEFSSVVYRTCDCARPTVKITLSSNHPKLTWAKVNGADKYVIYRAASKNGTYKKLATTTKLSFTNTSAGRYTPYYYKITAVSSKSSCSASSYSSVVGIVTG